MWTEIIKIGHPLFRLCLSFQTAIFTTIIWGKCPSSLQCWDSNPQPLGSESLPLTTRPGLLPSWTEILHLGVGLILSLTNFSRDFSLFLNLRCRYSPSNYGHVKIYPKSNKSPNLVALFSYKPDNPPTKLTALSFSAAMTWILSWDEICEKQRPISIRPLPLSISRGLSSWNPDTVESSWCYML